jgi:hypothetical protein
VIVWLLACERAPVPEPPAVPSPGFSGWLPEVEHRFYTEHLRRAEQKPFAGLLLPLRGVELPGPRVERARRDEAYAAWRFFGRWDFDGDGQLETWSVVEVGGSGGGVYDFTVERAGAEPIPFGAMTEPASSNLAGGTLPPELASERAVRFLAGALWGEEHLRSAEQIHGVFRWLLDERAGRAKLAAHGPFRERLSWRPLWEPGRPESPRDELLAVTTHTGSVDIEAFYGRGFEAPERVCSLGELELYRTGDALAVYDPARDASAWVHVAEGEYKAPTLAEAWCEGELVAFTERGPGVWLLDARAGRRGRVDALPETDSVAELQRLLLE